MTRRLKTIYVLIIAIVIYFILSYVYKTYIGNSQSKTVLILNKDVKRGENITKEYLSEVKVQSNTINLENTLSITDIDAGLVANNEYNLGSVLYKSMAIKEDEYIRGSDGLQIISLKINNSEDFASYKISKGSIVSIYYTGKTSQANEILNNMNKPMIISSSNTDSYISINLFDETKIVNIYDKYGNELLGINKNNESLIPDTVSIQIEKNMASIINNLKKYGDFTFTLIR